MKNAIKIILGVMFISYFSGKLEAQAVRSHGASRKTVVDHRPDHGTSSIKKGEVLFFDEADALFGGRTNVTGKYPIKYIGKRNRIKLTPKLYNGNESILKMSSGIGVRATIVKGKVMKLNLQNSNGKIIGRGVSQNITAVAKDNPVCLNCKESCVEEIDESGVPTGGTHCFTVCTVVECGSDDHNAVILPTEMVRPPAPPPSRPSKGTHERLQQNNKNARNQSAVKRTTAVQRNTIGTTTFVKRK